MLRESDEELFEDNPVEYIRRDMEGSDTDTRRRAACDLVRSLCRLFEAQVTPICLQCIQALLAKYQQNPAGQWKEKDAAIHLVLALSIRAFTQQRGVSRLNPGVDVSAFMTSYIMPELQAADTHTLPVLKADALKFVTTFRAQLNKAQYTSLFPFFVKFLGSPSYVVHTYAANAIERLLVQKDRHEGRNAPATLRFGRAALKPFLTPLLTALFQILERADAKENDYVMKAIMRVIGVSGEDVVPLITVVLDKMKARVGARARSCRLSEPRFSPHRRRGSPRYRCTLRLLSGQSLEQRSV